MVVNILAGYWQSPHWHINEVSDAIFQRGCCVNSLLHFFYGYPRSDGAILPDWLSSHGLTQGARSSVSVSNVFSYGTLLSEDLLILHWMEY